MGDSPCSALLLAEFPRCNEPRRQVSADGAGPHDNIDTPTVGFLALVTVRHRPRSQQRRPQRDTSDDHLALPQVRSHEHPTVRAAVGVVHHITDTITGHCPRLARRGVGPHNAAALLITAGDNPDRLRSEASFAALCGVNPLEASSGQTSRRRLL